MKFSRFAAFPVLTAALLLAADEGAAAPRAAEFGTLRMTFEANRGQAHSSVRYLSRGRGYTLLLRDREAILALGGGRNPADTVSFQWLGARQPSLAAEQPTGGVTNYLTAGFHQRDIPQFSRVRYSGLYRGIDLVYYGAEKQLEYDLIVSPGANPEQARFRVSGARTVELRDGELQIALNDREVRHRKPVVYQTVDGTRRPVSGEYVLYGRNEVGFRVGPYDKSRDLVIDPVVSYTFVRGGSQIDEATAIALDAAGNAYVGGYTQSADIPLLGPYRSAFQGTSEALVMKLNPAGQAVYVTFLGGSQDEAVR
jgi:hypothetical protein